ncbi:MAG TPA: TetR family transcriptional regulator [Baekduia sp.]|uniref:TetR/AcrR family transcriptional regulator n=1 Tax=Baekduia sp. TaxID=2600305 RepID=UPI002CADA88E|nr:TetR family transcriptional regulator [Baekduia sp.]HMJ34977.1 TetR family transcriptional regulator [Baekduia sp.]
MRASVALRGVAGSTFDHVARGAGVSRGLLHYYFASKERLLAEVVKRDTELRMAVLDEQLAAVDNAHDFIAMLRRTLDTMLRDDTEFLTLSFEVFTLSRRSPDIAAEFTELIRRTREQVAAVLVAKQPKASSSSAPSRRRSPRSSSASATASCSGSSASPTATTPRPCARARSRSRR